MVTPLGKAIEFFREFGLFDIVLPFLLIFAIMFAVLEKTRILGVNKVDGHDIPNKNLNAMVAFVIGMLVVAASNIVGVLNEALPNIILLLVVVISFLVLIGSLQKTGEMDLGETHKGYSMFFGFVILLGVLFIFLGAIRNDGGKSWLEIAFNWIAQQWQGPVFTSIIIVIIAVVAIAWLTRGGSTGNSGKNNDKKESK